MIQGHGDDAYLYGLEVKADFSSNVCHDVDRAPLAAHLAARLERLAASYPEPEPYTLAAAIAAREGVAPASVGVTNGATEAIYLVAQSFAGSRSAVVQPAFAEYADACRLHGHTVLPVRSMAEAFASAPDMVWLCDPNNPTGRVLPPGALREAVAAHPEVIFVVDRSYEHFTDRPLLTTAEAAAAENVVVLHSMTKRYAVPGLRLGYFTACEALCGRLRAGRQPWSVNAVAAEAGLFLLAHGAEVPLEALLGRTRRLRAAIAAIPGFEPQPTDTHIVLVRLAEPRSAELKRFLLGRGILIRDASNFGGLDGHWFRIAAQSDEANGLLIEALKQWR